MPLLDPKGIGIYGFTIPGDLDLRECRVQAPLYIVGCDIQGKVALLFAQTCSLFLRESTVAGGIDGDGVSVKGPLSLRKTVFSGKVSLQNARIGGDLDCKGVQIQVQQLPSIADPCTGKKTPEVPVGLSADGADIQGDVLLTEGFVSTGTVNLLGAHIKSDLDCKCAKLLVLPATPVAGEEEPRPPTALLADGAQVDGDVLLNEGFEATGEVRLLVAQIKGQLNLEGATLRPPASPGAAGQSQDDPDALSADGAVIGDSVIFTGGFKAAGTIRFPGAEIGGQLRFIGVDVARVYCTNLKLDRDFLWKGIADPKRASLDLTGARLRKFRDERASWPACPKSATEPNAKQVEGLRLNGLVYEELTLEDAPGSPLAGKARKFSFWNPPYRERIDWLKCQSPEAQVEPQPWIQLAKYLDTKGDSAASKHVLFTLRCLQAAKKGPLARAGAVVFAWIEEAPMRILISIAFNLLMGTLVYSGTAASGAMIPSTKDRFDDKSAKTMEHYAPFQPFVYTLENALPLVKLGQDGQVDARSAAQGRAGGGRRRLHRPDRVGSQLLEPHRLPLAADSLRLVAGHHSRRRRLRTLQEVAPGVPRRDA